MQLKAITKSSVFELIKTYPINNISDYNKFINWVIGEFDLYLKEESKKLKVYFPNGWFSIGNFKTENKQFHIEIKLNGKSKKSCENILKRLESIHKHVQSFVASNINQ